MIVDAEELPYEPLASDAKPYACPLCVSGGGGYRDAAVVEMEWHGLATDEALEVAICPSCRGFWLEPGMLPRLREAVLSVSAAKNTQLNERAHEKMRQKREAARLAELAKKSRSST